MSVRVASACVLLAVWLAVPVLAGAQGNDSDELAELEKRVAALERQIKPLVPLVEQVNKLEAHVAKTIELYQEKDAALESLVQKQNKTIELLGQKDREQEEILLAISRRDSQNRPILPLLSIMQESPEGAREIAEAVLQSLPQFGTVRIRNDTEVPQTVRVNGLERTVRPWATEVFERIPMGVVTTELVGYERPKHWTLAPPKRELEIRISRNRIRRVYEYWEWDPFVGWRRVFREL